MTSPDKVNRPIPCTSSFKVASAFLLEGMATESYVCSLGRHTMIGEIGLITGRPRSATIRAEVDSVLYELPRSAYDEFSRAES
jgi:CRP-like cAMP-binding protein